MEQSWLKCRIREGQFSDEFAVQGRLFNAKAFALFAPKNTVRTKLTPTKGEAVDGEISVRVLNQKGDLVLVSLPAPCLENGRDITVKKEQVTTTSK